ncbi:MAG: FHA domain-containing protein [SAR202 cluster bacterium]|nr:FHA domain-containing protein [SAR202 cluster bacterium]
MATQSAGEYFFDILDDGGRIARSVAVRPGATIGRKGEGPAPDVQAPPECQSTSRRHAVLLEVDGAAYLNDGSRYGTLVNGALVHNAKAPLRHGDSLVFGLAKDGWHVRFRSASALRDTTAPADALELLTVTRVPREVRIGRQVLNERLGPQRPYRSDGHG